MYNSEISYNQYKNYYLPQRIGPGALPNERVRMCFFCSKNGFDEPIAFKKRPDGSCQLLNYFTGQPHEHRHGEEVHERN